MSHQIVYYHLEVAVDHLSVFILMVQYLHRTTRPKYIANPDDGLSNNPNNPIGIFPKTWRALSWCSHYLFKGHFVRKLMHSAIRQESVSYS
ncbi:hypothetical protein [Neobacillus rhizophilus]|uniref:Uncharacterized protein n=1 Tax=Neobacillus rhizophilus TaxID=2833579 RepID=A0A942YYN4_9BACI|nr:hypothetical protein [Neobacillus rhizophilus]MBS4215176.1 hypothetical protein [Neobacillus rhizophilus]